MLQCSFFVHGFKETEKVKKPRVDPYGEEIWREREACIYRHLRIRLRHTPFSKLFRRDKKLIQIFNNAILKLRLTHNKLLLFLAFNK